MGKELAIAGAQIVESFLAVGSGGKAVFGAFSVAGEAPGTFQTLLGKRHLHVAEAVLHVAESHGGNRLLMDIAQLVFRENKVVASIQVAVALQSQGIATVAGQGAYARLHPAPVGEGGVKELHEIFSDVALPPFVEDGTGEMPPLFGSDRHGCELAILRIVVDVGETAVDGAFHDGSELQIVATDGLEETVELHRVLHILAVDHCHGVPHHLMLVEAFDAPHHPFKRSLSAVVLAETVMDGLRAVDGHAHKKSVVVEELCPFIRDERSVRLDAIVDIVCPGIFPLQLERMLIERDGSEQRLATMPGEEHILLDLCLDITAGEQFQGLVVHILLFTVGIEPFLL